MPRLILELSRTATAASVQSTVSALPFVQDATAATQANAVIVSVPDVTGDVRQQLANQSGVVAVHEDLQALPQVADREVEDFLQRVRDLRGEQEVPPLFETEPLRTDGGVALPPLTAQPEAPAEPQGAIAGIDDSLREIGVGAAHEAGLTGESVIAVTVDTGACGDSIRDDRQLDGLDLSGEGDAWTHLGPHGAYTTGIMAGDETTPGIDVGVLPGADVYPIKSTLASSELLQAQDAIVNLADRTGKPVIVNNSWGFQECEGICGHPVTTAIRSASQHPNVYQVFAAGNQGGETGCGTACDGSTVGISGPNSLDAVITVAASGLNGVPTDLMPYSSRGSQGSVSCGSRKPEIAAPIFGQVPWGCGEKFIANGGGTSGACPQVAGAVGLMVDANQPSFNAARRGIEQTADQFMGAGFNGCSGGGNIRADRAIEEAPAIQAGVGSFGRVGTALIAGGLAGAVLRRWLT